MTEGSLRPDCLRFPGCFTLAKQIVEELKLDYYTQNPSNLTLNEVLFLVAKKHELGGDIPSSVQGPPWRIKGSDADAEKINKLLNHSIRVQSGTIRGSEFDKYVLSNACLAVTGLLHVYLKQLRIRSNIVVGLLKFGSDPGADATPHIWLDIYGQTIDNAYAHFGKSTGAPEGFLYKMKTLDLYLNEDPEKTQRKLFYDQPRVCEEDGLPLTIKLFKNYGAGKQIEKLMATLLSTSRVNPPIKLYDIIMRNYLRKEFNLVADDLEEKWKARCWGCEGIKLGLKSCSVCKISKYCSTDCQKSDWKSHRLLHKEVERSTLFAIGLPEKV